MKKLNRSEKLKLIEAAKTIIIVLLFFLCIFLGYRILRLYKTQTNMEGALWGSVGGSAEIMESGALSELKVVYDLPQPYVITSNTYTSRQMLNADSQNFDDIAKRINQLLGEAYSIKSENISAVDRKEWGNALAADSIYVKYPSPRFLSFETELYNVKLSGISGKVKSFEELIVLWDTPHAESISLLMADRDSENVFKISISGDKAKSFRERAEKISSGEEKKYVFAQELNLDEKGEKRKTILDSMLIIPVAEEMAQTVNISVPKLYKSGLNFTKATDLTLSFVNAFNYNPNTIRQYVGQDNSIMFVGETGSLNLHPDGLVEYKALDSEDGVPLGGEKTSGSIVRGLCTLLEKVMRIGGINTAGADFSAKLTQMPQTFRFADKTELCFDYFVGDKRVEFSNGYGAWAVIQNGNLIELKMYLKNIERQGKDEIMSELFDVIDKFCAENPEIGEIRNAYGVYRYKEDAEDIEAEWKIEGVR